MSPDFTKIDLGSPISSERAGEDWPSPEGIDIKAAYNAADIASLDNLNSYPGLAPYIRGPYPTCLLYTSPSPRDKRQSRMPSSA